MVRFEKAPTKSSRAAIEAEMPSAFVDASWKKDLLVASSAQFVQCDITAAYGPGRKPKRRSRKHLASSAASTAFNTEIEQWLRAAHEVTPILVAFRRRDAEAGGTELSDWHAWSAKQAATFMPAFATSTRGKRESPAQLMAKGILLELVEADPSQTLSEDERALVGPLPGDEGGFEEAMGEVREWHRGLTSRGEPFSDEAARSVVELIRPYVPLGEHEAQAQEDWGTELYLAYHAATLQKEPTVARHIAAEIRRLRPSADVKPIYADYVRGAPNPKLRKLANEVLQPSAEEFHDASGWCSNPADALTLLECAALFDDPSSDIVRDGIAALLAGEKGATPQTVEELASRQPEDIDLRTARRWLRRASKLTDPSVRLNMAWLLIWLGKPKQAATTLAEAIRGGASALEVCAGQAVAAENVTWGRPWGNAFWARAVHDDALTPMLQHPDVLDALQAAKGSRGKKMLAEGARLTSVGEHDAAIEALLGAIDGGVEPNTIKEGLAFVPLRAHGRWRSIRKRPKKRG